MYNEKMHYYRCTDPKNAPPYSFYDYANGLVSYQNRLAQQVANYAGAYYLGYMTEKEVLNRPKGGRRPARLNRKQASRY